MCSQINVFNEAIQLTQQIGRYILTFVFIRCENFYENFHNHHIGTFDRITARREELKLISIAIESISLTILQISHKRKYFLAFTIFW